MLGFFSTSVVRRNPWFTFHCGWTLLERLTVFNHKLVGEMHLESVSPQSEKGGLNSQNEFSDGESPLFSFMSMEGPLTPCLAVIVWAAVLGTADRTWKGQEVLSRINSPTFPQAKTKAGPAVLQFLGFKDEHIMLSPGDSASWNQLEKKLPFLWNCSYQFPESRQCKDFCRKLAVCTQKLF